MECAVWSTSNTVTFNSKKLFNLTAMWLSTCKLDVKNKPENKSNFYCRSIISLWKTFTLPGGCYFIEYFIPQGIGAWNTIIALKPLHNLPFFSMKKHGESQLNMIILHDLCMRLTLYHMQLDHQQQQAAEKFSKKVEVCQMNSVALTPHICNTRTSLL